MDRTKSQCWVILKKRTLFPENLRFDRFSNLSNCTQPKPTNNHTKTFQILPNQGCKNEIISNLPTRCDLNTSKGIGPSPRGYFEPIVLGEGLLWARNVGVGLIFRIILQAPNRQF